MRHFYNRKSKKGFCELKGLPQSNNYSTRGQVLGTGYEPWCWACLAKHTELLKSQELMEAVDG